MAFDGKTGLNLAMSGDYDLLLLDWMLPGLSGIELCRQFRKEFPLTPFIFLTAKDTVEETVENIAGVSETLISVHEEYSALFFVLALILGAVYMVGFFLEYKKFKVSTYLTWGILCLAIANGVAAKLAGTSGGEIRSNSSVINLNTYGGEEDDDD